MIDRIPMPRMSGEILSEGLSQILQNMMARRLEEKRIAQTGEYQRGQLGIQQKQEERAEQVLPYLIQEHQEKIAHARRQKEISERMFPKDQTQNQGYVPATPEQTRINQLKPGESFQVGMNQTPMTSSGQTQLPSFKDTQDRLNRGEQVVMRGPTNPRLTMQDQYAGQTDPYTGMKIPDVKTRSSNGIRYDTYPSGLVIAQKEGLSEEEKTNLRIKQQEEVAESKEKSKQKTKDDDYFKDLAEFADNNKAAAEIFKRSPSVTGIWPSGKKFFKMGSADLGALNRINTTLIGDLAHRLNQRGSNYALQMAKSGKFDPTQHTEYNLGIIDANNDGIVRDYNRRRDAYVKKYGTEPPYKLPKFYRDWEKERVGGGEETRVYKGKTYKLINGEWHAKK